MSSHFGYNQVFWFFFDDFVPATSNNWVCLWVKKGRFRLRLIMRNFSKHLSIYSSQKESIFSILGRITTNAALLISFFLYLIFTESSVAFFIKWFFLIILFYHFCHFFSKTLDSINGFLGFIFFTMLWTSFWEYFLYAHSLLGLKSFFKDYLISENKDLLFRNHFVFLYFLICCIGVCFLGLVCFF